MWRTREPREREEAWVPGLRDLKHLRDRQALAKVQRRGECSRQGKAGRRALQVISPPPPRQGSLREGSLRFLGSTVGNVPMRPPEAR